MATIQTTIIGQFNTALSLLDYHLEGISDAESLWQPNGRGLTVRELDGQWVADWPESESYTIGAPSIAWLTWHIIFWWTMVLDHTWGPATLTREDVFWPGSIEAANQQISELSQTWLNRLSSLPDDAWLATAQTRWPFTDRPFSELAAWLNIELMKNAAEIGYCRFLYASR